MTTQQTSLSLADLISTLRTLTSGEKKKENKVAVPNSFDGSPSKASTFLMEVDLYLMANDTLYPNDKDKILFTLSYMKEGHTALWMKAKTDEYKKSLLEKEAEPPDTKPEEQGLHPALLKTCLLQPDQPDTIEGWYDRAKKYNNTWLTMMAITEGEKAKKSPKTETKVNRISDEEAQEYRRKGLCYKCSKPGHIAKNCQEKPKNDPKKENQKKSTPEDAYHKIRAIYRDFSEEEQTQILDLMEGGGF
uniref:CCHC-type domain-containing protein n=1 Tax=Moniliophthora roreri TaxID=221103 RepID=A0A0W0F7A1_MONRR